MEVACPSLLDSIMGRVETKDLKSLKYSWSIIGEPSSRRLDTCDEENDIASRKSKAAGQSEDILELLQGVDIAQLSRLLKLLQGVDIVELYCAQMNSEKTIADLRAQLNALEKKSEEQIQNLRLALQVHKSTADIITDSVKSLDRRATEVEEELSQYSKSVLSKSWSFDDTL